MMRFVYAAASFAFFVSLAGGFLPRTPLNATPPSQTAFDTLATDFADYLWPTEAGRIVTSTFGEYRGNHFHAGIDISSGDMTGYKVFAARAGYVSRININATGYGKILFVRHADGYTTAYAHLQQFAPAINARASQEQQRLERYPVDIECAPSEFPVQKGELIAFSGSTGTGSPHLHFEIRDRQMNPLNPFLCPALRVDDTIAPTIRRIALSPLVPEATVDGHREPRVFTAQVSGKNHYSIPGEIVLTGMGGFAVDVRDRIPGSRFRNGVYVHTLSIDGRIRYQVRLDRTPGQQAHEIGLYYDWFLREEGRGRFERLYMTSPNHVPFYSPREPWAGVIVSGDFSPGPHAFTISCSDFNGNTADVSGTIVIDRPPGFSADRMEKSVQLTFFDPPNVRQVVLSSRTFTSGWTEKKWMFAGHDVPHTLTLPLPALNDEVISLTVEDRWGTVSPPTILAAPAALGNPGRLTLSCDREGEVVRVGISSDGLMTSLPKITVYEGTRRFSAVPLAEDASHYVAWFRPSASFQGTRRIEAEALVNGHPAAADAGYDLTPIAPGTEGAITLDGGRLVIRYDSLSVLSPVFLHLEKSVEENETVYTLGPDWTVLGTGLTISVMDSLNAHHRALFARGRGSWELIGGRNGDPRTGRMRGTLEEIALLTDDTPPFVARLAIKGAASRRPRISFRFGDDLAGVEYDELKMYIDNRVVIPEVDGEHHRALYQIQEPLNRGPHLLTIHLKDRMGNSTTAEKRFDIR